jgi:hypothetical protein
MYLVWKLTAGEAPVRQNTATRIATDIRLMLLDVEAQGADSMWNLTFSPSVFISGNCYRSIKVDNELVVTDSRLAQLGNYKVTLSQFVQKGTK